MRQVYTFPPNYAAINRAFKVRGKPVIFCYGDTIHNPSRVVIPPSLQAHEWIHGARQETLPGGPARWWERYIEDPQFRLEEEIPAHRAEYEAGGRLLDIVTRLSSPLYGSLVTREQALALISNGTIRMAV